MVPDTYPGTEGDLKTKGLWDLVVGGEGEGPRAWEIILPQGSTTSPTGG